MFSVYDGYEKIKKDSKNVYFAGANTSNGFEGIYGDIADEKRLERVYIIKGAAGTGKSTIMKNIAKSCEEEGYPVEYYLCGSDPDSLDCIVIDWRIAVLDGTFPHTLDMKYPGCSSSMIDLSKFWDTTVLRNNREEIVFCSAEKSAAYASAYRYIKAAEQIENERYERAKRLFDTEKAEAFIERFIHNNKISGQKEERVKKLYSHALTMKGKFCTDLCEQAEGEVYRVIDTLGFASIFMDLLKNKLEKKGVSAAVSYMPLRYNITAISLEDHGISIIVSEDDKGTKNINLKRFMKTMDPGEDRGMIRLAGKCEKECTDEALACLAEAAEHHFRLEDIYKKSMDFENLGIYTASLCDEILFRLKNII